MSEPRPRSANSRLLASLMDPERGPEVEWEADDLRAILEHEMSVSMDGLGPAGGDLSLRELLDDPAAPLDSLRKAKEVCKAGHLAAGDPLLAELRQVLYLACIALARERHGERISELDDAALVHLASRALAQPWVPGELRELFRALRERSAG